MYDEQSLSHTKWECKYHIVWIPKYRNKAIFEDLRRYLGEIFRDLAAQKNVRWLKGISCPIMIKFCNRSPGKTHLTTAEAN
jgi:putative transposase